MTNIYARDVSNIATLDPYRLQELYQMHPCAEHVVKKLLVCGQREGGKDLDTDISDCIRTLTRWQAMRAEDAGRVAPGIDATSEAEALLIGLYDWSEVASRYKYAARNPDGRAFVFEVAPTRDAYEWKPISGDWGVSPDNDGPASNCDEWQSTLEARPQ